MVHQLKISFNLITSRRNNKGESPIFCKLSFQNTYKTFSTGFYITPELWDRESQRMKGIADQAQLTNTKLQEVNLQFIRIEKQLYDEGKDITLAEVYSRYLGKTDEKSLCMVFEERISRMESLVGTEYTASTLQKFKEVYAHVRLFIREYTRQQDIPLKQLNYRFIQQFVEFLLGKRLKPITINKIIQRLRQMVLYAIRCDYLSRDPFIDHKPLKEKKQIVFLTAEELHKLESHTFHQRRLETVKQIYLFSVYTGLGYHEASILQPKHIQIGFDGKEWITITRLKTDKEVSIPLLPQAKAILSLFEASIEGQQGFLLPRISNQKINSYMKEIADVLGIEKKLTHHTARKTFASTILLYNGVPIEVVSQLLGHSDIKVTQKSYAQVVQKSISNHMNLLEMKLKQQ
ncbi:site-specific integrase [Alistipes indistinctus]|jgi:integrase/recombinase XerD|uniref:site-specific integrase n=1 Tax=Alistipes indistinctus TaxID=626932 RepID=UPI00205A1B6D|nr:site-specific integrase [Alistipes indistinctus]DAT18202.1 MAG TPA: Integrase [Caudoviricetes sp.]